MSNVAEVPKQAPVQNNLNMVNLKVRIESMKQTNGNFYTLVTSPAKDDFSKPSQFIIRSTHNFGAIGQVIPITCELSGFVRSYEYTDKQGIQQQGMEGKQFLDLVS